MKTTALLLTLMLLAGCASRPKPDFTTADYGPYGEADKAIISAWVKDRLKDPDSAKIEFRDEPGHVAIRKAGTQEWIYYGRVKVWVNAKNSYGGYVGRQPYWVWYREGKIVKHVPPEHVPQNRWDEPAPATTFDF
jgi:hypothetical protein